jgi:hypothetical protein
MENQLYGRLTTLNKLRAVRDDGSKPKHVRRGADKSMYKIMAQLKDRKLMAFRERLIKATIAGDKYEVWKIENRMRAYEKRYEGIEISE